MGLDFLLTPSPVPPSPSNNMGGSIKSHLGLFPLLSSFPAREHHSHLMKEESSATDIKNLPKVIQLLAGDARI